EDVVAAVIVHDAASVSAHELREFARQNLAAFKAPSSVLIVASLPRNALGKVRRQALAAELADALHVEFVAPRGETETLIAGIFASVLGVSRVGACDHFFPLGGDSLHAAQVLRSITRKTGVDLETTALFASPTVEELAQRVAAAAIEGAANAGYRPIERRNR